MLAAIDSNIWGILAMPTGLFICFGPVLVAWVLAELNDPSSDKDRNQR